MHLHISKGNSKLGLVPNISLPPGASCGKVPCTKACYAQKFYRCYTAAREQWGENHKLWKTDPKRFKNELSVYLDKRKPTRFRWHVGGEIPDRRYLRLMCDVAAEHKDTKFFAYTKRYGWLQRLPVEACPTNLTLIASRWPGWPCPEDVARRFPQSWVLDPKYVDIYIPANARFCPGSCRTCDLCWMMKAGDSVVFHRH